MRPEHRTLARCGCRAGRWVSCRGFMLPRPWMAALGVRTQEAMGRGRAMHSGRSPDLLAVATAGFQVQLWQGREGARCVQLQERVQKINRKWTEGENRLLGEPRRPGVWKRLCSTLLGGWDHSWGSPGLASPQRAPSPPVSWTQGRRRSMSGENSLPPAPPHGVEEGVA